MRLYREVLSSDVVLARLQTGAFRNPRHRRHAASLPAAGRARIRAMAKRLPDAVDTDAVERAALARQGPRA